MENNERKIDIVGKIPLWFGISGAVIGIGIIFMIINVFSPGLNYGHNYPLKLGIDFTGGNIYRLVYNVPEGADLTQTEGLVADIHVSVDAMAETIPLVQAGIEEGALIIQIRTDETVKEREKEDELKASVLASVKKHFTGAKLDASKYLQEYVGPVIGRELAYRGIMGLLVGGLLILVYVGFRMSFDFAVCAIAALFHDVLVLCGVFAIIRVEIDSSFVAAILTVVGYSINDTIVIFDRIRENTGLKKGMRFADIVNLSLVQTIPRSINTSLTTLFPLLCLILFGGSTIKHFCIALMVGVISGTYSSIFNASAILVAWRASKQRKFIASKESMHGAGLTVPKLQGADVSAPVADIPAGGVGLPAASTDGPTQYGPGKGSKKKKKRKR